MLGRIEEGEDLSDERRDTKNLDRKLRRYKLGKTKRKNTEQQSISDSRLIFEEDENSNLQVNTLSTYGSISTTVLSLGVNACIDEDDLSSSCQYSPNLTSYLGGSGHTESWRDISRNSYSGTGDTKAIYDFAGNMFSTSSPFANPLSFSIPSQPPVDPTVLNLSRVLKCVQDFSESQIPTLREGFGFRNVSNSAESTLDRCWLNVKHCIYLYKLNDMERAGPLLEQLCLVSPEVISYVPDRFLRDLLTAFSPVNFRRHPQVRKKLLGHFTKMAEEAHGPEYSITVICKELQKDEDTRHTTELALSCMLDSMSLAGSRLKFDIKRSIIALLRRDHAQRDALQLARDLVVSSKKTPKRKPDEVRDADMELAHVHMDIGNFNEAKELCRARVGKAVARDGLIGHVHHDRRAIIALEDLAKIEEQFGELGNSATWLGHAAEVAKEVEGPSITLTHILDKLDRALRRGGRLYEAEATARLYASYTWTEDMDVARH